MRSSQAIARRRKERTTKRRIARQCYRKDGELTQRRNSYKMNEQQASAQEPTVSKIDMGEDIWIATINARGMKRAGKREELEA